MDCLDAKEERIMLGISRNPLECRFFEILFFINPSKKLAIFK